MTFFVCFSKNKDFFFIILYLEICIFKYIFALFRFVIIGIKRKRRRRDHMRDLERLLPSTNNNNINNLINLIIHLR
jgi:hypothetical protein